MNWKHGYYADSGYTYGYYAETMPMRLRWAALIQNHNAPANKFRYLDAGCGQGLNLILAAIAHPDSEFVGIDFLPQHIVHARELADRCGLTNVTFIEGDFIALAENPNSLGEFDYAVCHGISTWIAPIVKQGLFRLIGQVLKPGGVFYNSYNTFPGWLGVVPFQHLVLLEQRSKTGALALGAAQQSMATLREHSPGMFNALPGLQARMNSMEAQDPAYLVQEYNNQFWQPVFVTQMMDEMAVVKLDYLGTATLPEAYDGVLPAAVQTLLQQQPTAAIKEQVRDYAINQTFRRDLYVKGQNRPWTAAMNEMLRDTRFVANPLIKRPETGQSFNIKGGSVELNGDASFYGGLIDLLSNDGKGRTVGELIDSQATQALRNSVVQAMSMMLHAGYVQLLQPTSAHNRKAQINATKALAEAACEGAPYKYAPTPAVGGAQTLSDTEWVMLREHLHGKPSREWAELIFDNLQRLGRALAKNGQAVTDEQEQKNMLDGAIKDFTVSKLPFFQSVGGA